MRWPLHALDRAAEQRRTGFVVVSEDVDWRAFCEKSRWLYLVPRLEEALSLISNAPIELRRAVLGWFAEGQDGREEVDSAISRLIEGLDVDVTADATSGEVETNAWSPEVRFISWPNDENIEIIEIDRPGDGRLADAKYCYAFQQFVRTPRTTPAETQAAAGHRQSIKTKLEQVFGMTAFFRTGSFETAPISARIATWIILPSSRESI